MYKKYISIRRLVQYIEFVVENNCPYCLFAGTQTELQSLEFYPMMKLARRDLDIWQVVLKIEALNVVEMNTQRLKLIKIDADVFAVACALNGCREDLITTQLCFNNFYLVLIEVKYLDAPFLMYTRKWPTSNVNSRSKLCR